MDQNNCFLSLAGLHIVSMSTLPLNALLIVILFCHVPTDRSPLPLLAITMVISGEF